MLALYKESGIQRFLVWPLFPFDFKYVKKTTQYNHILAWEYSGLRSQFFEVPGNEYEMLLNHMLQGGRQKVAEQMRTVNLDQLDAHLTSARYFWNLGPKAYEVVQSEFLKMRKEGNGTMKAKFNQLDSKSI